MEKNKMQSCIKIKATERLIPQDIKYMTVKTEKFKKNTEQYKQIKMRQRK